MKVGLVVLVGLICFMCPMVYAIEELIPVPVEQKFADEPSFDVRNIVASDKAGHAVWGLAGCAVMQLGWGWAVPQALAGTVINAGGKEYLDYREGGKPDIWDVVWTVAGWAIFNSIYQASR